MPRKVIIVFSTLIVLAGVTIGLLRRKELAKSPIPASTMSTTATPSPVVPTQATSSSPAVPTPVAPTAATTTYVKPVAVKPLPVTPAPAAPASYAHKIQVGPQTLFVDVATTPAQMQLGLSDRVSMGQNQGMLFNFVTPQMPEFWMNDMNFPLDFLWINSGKIVGITPDAPAAPKNADGSFNDSNLPLYPPPSPVDEVIEVNAGWAQKNSITEGNAVSLIN